MMLRRNARISPMSGTIKETVRSNLRRLMDQNGWNQVELARRSKVSQTYIGKLLRGESVPTVDKVEDLAEAFGISALDLMRAPVPRQDLITEIERLLRSAAEKPDSSGQSWPEAGLEAVANK